MSGLGGLIGADSAVGQRFPGTVAKSIWYTDANGLLAQSALFQFDTPGGGGQRSVGQGNITNQPIEIMSNLGGGTTGPQFQYAGGGALDAFGIFGGAIASFATNRSFIFQSSGNANDSSAYAIKFKNYGVTTRGVAAFIRASSQTGPFVANLDFDGTTFISGFDSQGRIVCNGQTGLVNGNWLATGWGPSAVLSTGGTEQRGWVQIVTNIADTPTANPYLTLTFPGGAYVAAPVVAANVDENASTVFAAIGTSSTTTTLRLRFLGTPTATSVQTYRINFVVVG